VADVDSSTCETASVASGDDVSSILYPHSNLNDLHVDGLICNGTDSSDVEDTNGDNKEGLNNFLYVFLLNCMVLFNSLLM